MGVLAIYGYTLPETIGEHSKKLNEIIQDVYLKIKIYFEKKNTYLVLPKIITLFSSRSSSN